MTAPPTPVPTVTQQRGVGPGGRAHAVLGKRKRLGVVDHADRQPGGLGDDLADRHVEPAPRQVGQVAGDAGRHVDVARHADPDAGDLKVGLRLAQRARRRPPCRCSTASCPSAPPVGTTSRRTMRCSPSSSAILRFVPPRSIPIAPGAIRHGSPFPPPPSDIAAALARNMHIVGAARSMSINQRQVRRRLAYGKLYVQGVRAAHAGRRLPPRLLRVSAASLG